MAVRKTDDPGTLLGYDHGYGSEMSQDECGCAAR